MSDVAKQIAENPVLQAASRFAMILILAVVSLIGIMANDVKTQITTTQAQQSQMLQQIADIAAKVEYDHQAIMKLTDNLYDNNYERKRP